MVYRNEDPFCNNWIYNRSINVFTRFDPKLHYFDIRIPLRYYNEYTTSVNRRFLKNIYITKGKLK